MPSEVLIDLRWPTKAKYIMLLQGAILELRRPGFSTFLSYNILYLHYFIFIYLIFDLNKRKNREGDENSLFIIKAGTVGLSEPSRVLALNFVAFVGIRSIRSVVKSTYLDINAVRVTIFEM